jgi:protein-S-isoprenylcysteine O-methyltransferase Ste14
MTDRFQGWVLVATQLALLGILALAPTGTAWPLPDVVRMLGTIGRIVGAAAIVIGGLRLGLAASVHPAPTAAATLRTDGPYRYVRHPIYTGVLTLGAALGLAGRSPIHVAAWVSLLGVLTVKARFEERLLTDRFGGYPAYAARTGRFLPRRKSPKSGRVR